MNKTDMKNLSVLRQELLFAFTQFKEGNLSIKQLNEVNKLAKNVIDSCRVQLAYEYTKKNNNRITYIEEDNDD